MRVLVWALLLAFTTSINAQALPIFDAHLHYSHDAWDVVPVQEAIAIMRKAGVKRALVSSSGDDGQQRLYAAAPDLVILDADAVERLLRQWPQARILWAHAGFERPERVAEMLRKHRSLWCDLAFRTRSSWKLHKFLQSFTEWTGP